MSTAKIRTAAIYARFSNDELQKQRSIDDQVALCRDVASRQQMKVVATFSDRGKSSATLFDRDGLLEMMGAAKAHRFDVVIVESLDRLSRDQEDLPGLFKRLTFFEVEMLTANEGVATPIHVGLRGMYGAMFLKDLGDKVRRGHSGRVREGKFPGATPYGYRRVLGKPGEREIDPERAAVVRRIFKEYVDGRSPRAIAAGLAADGIPSPSGGRFWNFGALIGGSPRGSGLGGLIGNPIYRGELVWNTTRRVLNPETGRKIKRAVPPEEFIRTPVPHLAIVDAKVWDAAQAVRDGRSAVLNHERGVRPVLPRREHLLAGLLRCGVCGGHMRLSNGKNRRVTKRRPGPPQWAPRVACAAASSYRTCSHSKSYDLEKLEAGVLQGIREHLVDPELIKEAARGFHAKWAEQERKARSDGTSVRKRLNRVQVQIDRLVAAIRDSDTPVTELTAQLRPLEAERVGLAERLRLIEAEKNVVTLHPNVIDAYRMNIDRLHHALTSKGLTAENRATFRNLVDSIVVHATGFGKPYEFTPYGRLSALMGVDLFPSRGCDIVQPEKTADAPPPGTAI
jgi:DNA invertase Pin-like site-specific DNA recombinase